MEYHEIDDTVLYDKDSIKTVNLPITISVGDFCYSRSVSCPYFDQDGGEAWCMLQLDQKGKDAGLKFDSEYIHVPKPKYCKELKEV